MEPYDSNTTLEAIAVDLKSAKRILLTTHAKPDGDALGAVVALGQALQTLGVTVERWIMPPIGNNIRSLIRDLQIHYHQNEGDPLPVGEPDRIIVLDTGAWSQLDPLRKWLEPRHERITVIDHHLHGDEVGRQQYVDPQAAAVCEIVAALIDCMGCEYDKVIREALYVGIASDTGWFRFSNTTAHTHELAARLIRAGVDHPRLYSQVEQSDRPEKLRLFIRALDGLQLIADGAAAVMTLRSSDFDDTGARPDETERLIDLPQIVADVKVVALLTEVHDHGVRVSFRSKPGEDAVDVNKLAQQFGGGGHARASGAKIAEPFDIVCRRVIEAIEASCGQHAS